MDFFERSDQWKMRMMYFLDLKISLFLWLFSQQIVMRKNSVVAFKNYQNHEFMNPGSEIIDNVLVRTHTFQEKYKTYRRYGLFWT